MTGNNSNLDLVNINAQTKFGQILSMSSQDIENLTPIKGHNSVTNLQKMTGNNPKLDFVNINANKKFGQILQISSLEIEQKRNSEGNAWSNFRICPSLHLTHTFRR